MTTRRRFTIVYDFDGTLLPLGPWDSEQELLLSRLESVRAAFWRRWYGRLVVEADRRGWQPRSFKRRYLRLLRGTPAGFLDQVALRLAARILPQERDAVLTLARRGHRLLIASCGTADLSERVLAICGILPCFEALFANRFVFQEGRISGMRLEVPSGRAKLEIVKSLGIDPAGTVAVGDGITDQPLWQWSAVPVVVGRGRRAALGRGTYRVVASCAGVLDLVVSLGG